MNKTFIIAEAGVNHNGSTKIAKKLIEKAAKAGADAVKFQTYKTEELVCENTKKANYQIINTGNNETQYKMLKKLELKAHAYKELIEHCKKNGIMFLSTPFGIESVELLKSLHVKIFKISSGDITNLPLLKRIGSLNKKVILSTGMSNMKEIQEALNILTAAGTKKKDITILHCNTEYPTPYKDVNLKAMLSIKDKFNVNVGYSDHTNGIEVPIAATALGASVIEKHFTLDRKMKGPDHKASLEPKELESMVKCIRHIEEAKGNGNKVPSKSEIKNLKIARKSIVAKVDIGKGDEFNENNITTKRQGTGISPMNWCKVIGKKAKKNIKRNELIKI